MIIDYDYLVLEYSKCFKDKSRIYMIQNYLKTYTMVSFILIAIIFLDYLTYLKYTGWYNLLSLSSLL